MQNLPHLLKRAHYAARQAIDAALAEHGLTAAQLDVLARVAACECAEHRSLLQDMDIASPTLTKLVNGLVESGYLERQISPDDARVKVFVLTEAGLALQQRVRGTYATMLDQFFVGFSPAERLLLLELLQRLLTNIECAEA